MVMGRREVHNDGVTMIVSPKIPSCGHLTQPQEGTGGEEEEGAPYTQSDHSHTDTHRASQT